MGPVRLFYYNWESGSVPLFLVLLGTLLTGAVIAWLFEIIERFRLHKIIRKQKKKISALESRIEEELSRYSRLDQSPEQEKDE